MANTSSARKATRKIARRTEICIPAGTTIPQEWQGKIVLQLTISPAGEVTDCRLLSSELNDDDLERKIVARVKLFRFEAKDVEAITARKTLEFFPT
jgi:TonB family protein